MATTVAVLEALLRADTRDFDKDMRRSEGRMHKFGKVAKAGALAAGAGIAYGLGKVAKIGWDEFNEGQKVAAQTNAVLKSTGRVANVSKKDVQGLAKAIMLKTGIDDEAIASGENMLLTFKNIRNEQGMDNKVFSEATNIMADMSVALGQDMTQSAMQLGKALNDPTRGMTALRRVGVTFTESQEKLIQKLQKSGDTMGAQKVILEELRGEFGGSARAAGETLGGQINILRERFNNWAGDLVSKVIPVVKDVAGVIGDLFSGKGLSEQKMRGLARKMQRQLQKAINSVDWRKTGERIGEAISTAIKLTGEFLRSMVDAVIENKQAIFDAMEEIVHKMEEWVNSHYKQIGEVGAVVAAAIFTTLADPVFWAEHWQLALAVALAAIPFGKIAGLGGKLALHFGKGFGKIGPLIVGAVIRMIAKLDKLFDHVPRMLREVFQITSVYTALTKIKDFAVATWERIEDKVRAVFRVIQTIVNARLGVVRDIFALVRATARFTWDFIRDKTMVVVDAVQKVIDKVSAFIRKLRELKDKATGWLPDIGGLFSGIGSAVRGATGRVGDFGSGGFGATSLVALGQQLQSMGFQVGEHPRFGGVSGGHVPGSWHYKGRAIDVNWPGGGAMEMRKLDWLNSRLRTMPGVKELLWRTAGHFDHLHLAMDKGGVVPGRRGAPVPVLAHGGETFIPTHKGGSWGSTVYNFNGPVLNGEGLLRFIEQQSKVSGRRGGPRLNFGT